MPVLGLTETFTADNGAVLGLSLVVRSSTAWNDGAGAAQVAAITNWCLGEVDAAVMASQKFSVAQVDYTATQVGPVAWPSDIPLLVMPTTEGVSLAASGFTQQLELLPHAPCPR